MSENEPGSLDFDLLAASLRADTADVGTWVSVLGTKLAGALPARVRLRHGGIFGGGPVSGFTVDLGPWRFGMRQEHGQPVGERTHVVRDIALKTETLPLDIWLDALIEALAALAASSARERAAIQGMLS